MAKDKFEYKTTEDIAVPEKLVDQVIGQDRAVNIIKKAARQRRNILLMGSPGTGKSMLAQAMAELMPAEELEDVLIYPNPLDENMPLVRVVKTYPKDRKLPKGAPDIGEGRRIIEEMRMRRIGGGGGISPSFFILSIIVLALLYLTFSGFIEGDNKWVIAAAVLGIFIFGAAMVLASGVSRRMGGFESSEPKLIIDNSGKKAAPFVDATGAKAGALFGDVRHDPLQCIPAGENVVLDNGNLVPIERIVDPYFQGVEGGEVALENSTIGILGGFDSRFMLSPATIRRVYRRKYCGKIINLKTRGGSLIRVTPNHPIATVGFDGSIMYRIADEMRMGDRVVISERTGCREGLMNKPYAFDEIVEIKVEQYGGFVYNLTTNSGNYLVDFVLTHNSGGLGTPAHLRVEAGAIHRSNKGVLFLDEVSSLGPKSQQELLTAMQEKKYSITGQSEMSSGAIVKTEPVSCLPYSSIISAPRGNFVISKYVDSVFEQNGDKILKFGEVGVVHPSKKMNVLSRSGGHVLNDAALLLYRRPYKGKIIKIGYDDGTESKVTPEHPILTTNGFIKAIDLDTGDFVVGLGDGPYLLSEADLISSYGKQNERVALAYLTFKGMRAEMPINSIAKLLAVDEKTIREWKKGVVPVPIKCVNWLKSKNLLPLMHNDKRLPKIARIVGALFGDGGITQSYGMIYFTSGLNDFVDLSEFKRDLIGIFGNDVAKNIKIRRIPRGLVLGFYNAFAGRFLASLGIPTGSKVAKPFSKPQFIAGDEELEKEFFTALLACEMYGNIKRVSDGPSFVMAKVKEYEKEHVAFLGELVSFLRKYGVICGEIKMSREYLKRVNGKRVPAAKYKFRFATNHNSLLRLLKFELPYASEKVGNLKKVGISSKSFLKNQVRLKKAYSRIPELRDKGVTIRRIAKRLRLDKNTVLKLVPRTHRAYSKDFKEGIQRLHNEGCSPAELSTWFDIPESNVHYWIRHVVKYGN